MSLDISKLSDNERKLLEDALKTYQLLPEHVFSFSIHEETREAVIVTNGGKKIRHRKGDPASVQLTETDKTGIAPEQEMVWVDRLNGRVGSDELSRRK